LGAGSSQMGHILSSATFGTFMYTMNTFEPGNGTRHSTFMIFTNFSEIIPDVQDVPNFKDFPAIII
jgi:hypothetical protein